MLGMVFGELKKFVDKNLQGDSWRALLKEAGLSSRSYVPTKAYPDQELMSLVATATNITGLDKPILLNKFGEFIAPNLLSLFRRQIKSEWNVMDLLEHIENTIHNVVRLRNPGAKPPQLRCQRVSPQHVIIHYTSSRRLCHLGLGIVKGIAEHFGDPYQLEQTTCMLHGDDSCQISIKLNTPIEHATQFSTLKLEGSEALDAATTNKEVELSPEAPPIVIIGTGPVGIHAARKLIRKAPQQPLIIYGAEPWEPYNRVRLSELLSGDIEWENLANKLDIPENAVAHLKINSTITGIDRKNNFIIDAAGNIQHYSKLILALGSRAKRADQSAKLSLSGIYTYRDIDDAQDLITNVVQSEHTIVTGGGVLGIEVAFALKAQNPDAEVTILHRQSDLMNKQLGHEASSFLLQQVQAERINVILKTAIVDFIGNNEITGIMLDNGDTIPCDTLISCTGIVPNTELASDAGLKTERGIIVDDLLRTNDLNIYAIGECAQHRNKTYGLLGPGLEQANIAVESVLNNKPQPYCGTSTSVRVKVKHLPIFTIEKKGLNKQNLKRLVYKNAQTIQFREILLYKGHLVGATTIGEWPEIAQAQDAIKQQKCVRPWHRWNFKRTGTLWPQETIQNPLQWPDQVMVCTCNAVTRGELGAAIAEGCQSVKTLSESTGAGQGCGSCAPLLAQLIGSKPEPTAPAYKTALLLFTTLAVLMLGGLALPAFQLPSSFQETDLWTMILFDSGWQQVTGYTALTLLLLSFVLSINKRFKLFKFASYNFWRVVHVALIAIVVAIIMIHTNLGLGQGFNYQFMAVFLLSLASGTFLGLMVIMEGGIFATILRNIHAVGLRFHILLIWVLFALLPVHIFSVYYF